jgi:predicted  nucleic acid-binding Zn-ribbon protein
MEMQTAQGDIGILIQIVKQDFEIQMNRKVVETAPVRIKEIDKKVKEMDGEYEESQAVLKKLEKEKIRLEENVKYHNAKIAEKQSEQSKVKTNKEYKALTAEIAYLLKQIDQEEERIITILDQMETKRKEVGAITSQIDSERGALLDEKRRLEEEVKVKTERLQVLDDEKVRILTRLSEHVRHLYNRILKVKHDSGVANLVGDICQGCYTRIPPQKAHEIRKNNQIITCEGCGRILVYYQVETGST